MKTKEEVLKVISGVKHPAIDYSLVDLGMIKDNIEVVDNIVIMTEEEKVKFLQMETEAWKG